MQSAFDVLTRDHMEIMRLLRELELGPTATSGASSDELALRKEMVQQLILEVSKHEAAEEVYFWPAVRTRVPDGDALASQALGQEEEGKAILDRIGKLGPEDEEFEGQLAEYARAGRAHILLEETTIWPALREALAAQEADHLGYLIDGAKKTAASRPHP
jgi:hemerythrin superfamily protein